MTPIKIGGELPCCTSQKKYSGIDGLPRPSVFEDANLVILQSLRIYKAILSENFHIYRNTMCIFDNAKCKHNITI